MSFVAAATGTVHASPATCFERFADFPAWSAWMPKSFRPVRGPSRALAVGDRMVVRIAVAPLIAIPAKLKVVRVDAGRAIAWRGGNPALLAGEHTFTFEDDGKGGARVTSSETWTGALTHLGPFARKVKRDAERLGGAQLDAFTAWVEKG